MHGPYHPGMRFPFLAALALVGLWACHATPTGMPAARVRDLPGNATPADQVVAAARDQIERGLGKDAWRQLDAVLARDPHHMQALRLRQDVLRERGRRGRLQHEADAALRARPESSDALYLHGRIVRDRSAKLQSFQRASELAPDSAWPWLGLAHTLRQSDPERAEAIYTRLFHASAAHPLVAIAYAAVLRENRKSDAALAVYGSLAKDSASAGAAALGRAQIAIANDQRSKAWSALLLALRSRPYDPGVQALVLGFLEAGCNDDQAAQLLDALREDPRRLQEFSAGDGLSVLSPLLLRGGQIQSLRTALVAAKVDARRPAMRRVQRRLELMVGEVWSFLGMLQADIPRELVAAEPNRLRARWLALLDGPWFAIDPTAPQMRSWNRSLAADLTAALRDVGMLHEAELLAESALHEFPGDARCLALRDEVRTEIAFEAGVRRLLYQGYQERDGADLTTVLQRLRELSQRVFGRCVVGSPPLFSAPLVGEMADPFAGPLAEHFDRYNKHFVLGRRAGGTAEGLLLARLSLAELPESSDLALPARCFEVVGVDRDVKSLGGVLGGDLAGVALLNHFLIDHDAVREWAASIADRRRVAAEDDLALAADPLPAAPGMDPFDVAWRLALLSPVQDTALDAAVLDMIRHHERQHLVDSFYYLPVESNLWRSLGLLFEFAFSPSAIEAEMERRAELASLVVSPHTELVLAHIADFLQEPTANSPHHQGFGTLGRELTEALVAAGVAAETAVPSRWHLVPRATVQKVARQLLGQLP